MRVLGLLLSSSSWIHRRVEKVTFRDHRTVRRQVSVDFTISEAAPVLSINGVRHWLLPFATMRRKSLVNFDFR
ncbi:MAG TPA: hypothetical protein VKD67_04325, partial [Acidimicrobiales bacterium]|nr:hypothetical protein [Acidimicrobiales bacterium]